MKSTFCLFVGEGWGRVRQYHQRDCRGRSPEEIMLGPKTSFLAIIAVALLGCAGDAAGLSVEDITGASLCGGISCDARAECVGGKTCRCRQGFSGDGVNFCTDLCAAGPAQRLNCYQDGTPTETMCIDRGCCWRPLSVEGGSAAGALNTSLDPGAQEQADDNDAVPPCYYHLSENTYELSEVAHNARTLTGKLKCSSPAGPGQKFGGAGWFGSEICSLKLDVSFDTKERIRVKISDPGSKRWEVPDYLYPGERKGGWEAGEIRMANDYKLTYTRKPFGLAIARASTGIVVFNSTPVGGLINGLAFEEQFWEWSSQLEKTPIMYGLGQQKAPFRLPVGQETGLETYTLWARDPGGTPDHAAKGGSSLYGSHPLYMQLSKQDGTAVGVMMRSSNAIDVSLSPRSVTWRSSGGIIDMTVFMGPTAKDVVRQYTHLVGRPHLPPMWALGFHLCRWGYQTVEKTRSLVERMRALGMPHDAQWNDIDLYDGFRNFDLNPLTFPREKVAAMVDDLHANGQRYVMIVDAAIESKEQPGGYPARDRGLELDVFVRSKGGAPLTGKVWPGLSYFPDFFHPNSSTYWGEMLASWRDEVKYDGVWLDMNEPSNFCDGECSDEPSCGSAEGEGDGNECVVPDDFAEVARRRMVFAPWKLKGMRGKKFDASDPPYIPGSGKSLDVKTVSMSATHCVPDVEWGEECSKQLHYNVHNLYGLAEARATAKVLPDIMGGKRALIITRSTYPGSGHVAGTWLGDSGSTWEDMRLSVGGIMSMGLFGVPLVGADICGFFHNTTRELCVRWHQVGSMYPFSRNHNDLESAAQDPTAWDEEARGIIKAALTERYSLLSYFYTLFHEAQAHGTPVARPLLMEFPGEEAVSLADVDEQFMVGSALLVSPVLHQGATSIEAHFPSGVSSSSSAPASSSTRWFDLRSGDEVRVAPGKTTAVLDTPLSVLPLHVRSGHIIPIQVHVPVTTTTELRKTPVTWLVALERHFGGAGGSLVMDDGESVLPSASLSVSIRATINSKGAVGGNLTSHASGDYDPKLDSSIGADVLVGGVSMYGVSAEDQYLWGSTDIYVNGQLLPPGCIKEDSTMGVVRAEFVNCKGVISPTVRQELRFVWQSRSENALR